MLNELWEVCFLFFFFFLSKGEFSQTRIAALGV